MAPVMAVSLVRLDSGWEESNETALKTELCPHPASGFVANRRLVSLLIFSINIAMMDFKIKISKYPFVAFRSAKGLSHSLTNAEILPFCRATPFRRPSSSGT